MNGLNYKTFLFHDFAFFDVPSLEDDTLTIEPFKTRTPDFTGIATDFQNYNNTPTNFATYQCTAENTTFDGEAYNYFNISLDGYLYTGDNPGIYQFIFKQYNINNDDLSYFYFGENALHPTNTNYSTATIFNNDDNVFTTPYLDRNSYYPILLYYGQSFGGAYLAMGLISPGDASTDYSPSAFVPIICPPPSPEFQPIIGKKKTLCIDQNIYRPINGNKRLHCTPSIEQVNLDRPRLKPARRIIR